MPFGRFPGADALLGPEMKLHRRGHGHRRQSFPAAYMKTQMAIELRPASRAAWPSSP